MKAPLGTFKLAGKEISVARLDSSHNEEILRILAATPMRSTAIDLAMDRSPNAFTVADIHYDPYTFLGFFCEGELHGFGLVGYEQLYVNGAPEWVFHFTDFFLDEVLRGQRLFYPACQYLFGEYYGGSKTGYSITLAGNKPAVALIGNRPDGYPWIPYSRVIAEMEVRTILITFKKSESTEYQVRTAELSDIDDIARLLNEEHRQRLFGRVYSRDVLLALIDRRPDFNIGNYYLAEKDGRIVGVAALWDTTSFRRLKVTRYSFIFNLTRILHKALGLLFRFEPLPRKGNAFKDIYIVDYAIDRRDIRVMEALLLKMYADCRAAKYHMINFGSSGDDPLLQAANRFMTERVKSTLILISPEEARLKEVDVRLPFVDNALL